MPAMLRQHDRRGAKDTRRLRCISTGSVSSRSSLKIFGSPCSRRCHVLRKKISCILRKKTCIALYGIAALCIFAGFTFVTYTVLKQIVAELNDVEYNADEVKLPLSKKTIHQVNLVPGDQTNHNDLNKKGRKETDSKHLRVQGYRTPENISVLPNLALTTQKYSRQELLSKYSDMDIIYTFVNGSEINHAYRKTMSRKCGQIISSAEIEWRDSMMNMSQKGVGKSAAAHIHSSNTYSEERTTSNVTWSRVPKKVRSLLRICKSDIFEQYTVETALAHFKNASKKSADSRDRDLDELRFSFRSLEQHIRWHRGRVVVVSPGHHPTWVDAAKNFLSGQCAGPTVENIRRSGKHLRITTVHQDSILPHGARLTINSHAVEQQLWRVKNISSVHLYFNDDYFVNSDVDITDVLNEYGGTVVRTEAGIVTRAEKPKSQHSWSDAVANSNLFNIVEIDMNAEDHLPATLTEIWRTRASSGNAHFQTANAIGIAVTTPDLDSIVSTSLLNSPPGLPEKVSLSDLQKSMTPTSRWEERRGLRRYAAHAPFAYCTNMFRFLSTRYELELGRLALNRRSRSSHDLLIPFIYNAFIEARPWQASPNFLPYLVALHDYRSRKMTAHKPVDLAAPELTITLNNDDGCAPATVLIGREQSRHIYGKVLADPASNKRLEKYIKSKTPLFFNLNAGCSSENCTAFQSRLLNTLFSSPTYLERTIESEVLSHNTSINNKSNTDSDLKSLFHDLMQLPIVLVSMFAENTCPLLRSLQLALREYRGAVKCVVTEQSNAKSNDEVLQEARDKLLDGLHSVMPVTDCVFGGNVQIRKRVPQRDPASHTEYNKNDETAASGDAKSDISDIARSMLGYHDLTQAANAHHVVAMPASCGSAYDGLRVHGFVIDSRASRNISDIVGSAKRLRVTLGMPGQTLALEDFRAAWIGPEKYDVVLVLDRRDADARSVHWITGATKKDLLLTYPLPYSYYEQSDAPILFD